MLEVTGTLFGENYHVVLTGDPAEPVRGSAIVLRLLELALHGHEVARMGPTGPYVPVSADDPGTILALLTHDGTVESVTGAPSPTCPPPEPGVIY